MLDENDILLYNAVALICVTILAGVLKFWPLIFLWFLFRIKVKIVYEDENGDEDKNEERTTN